MKRGPRVGAASVMVVAATIGLTVASEAPVEGAACVVVAGPRAAGLPLPSAAALPGRLNDLLKRGEAAGFRVSTDPTGTCLAAALPVTVDDQQLRSKDIDRVALMAGVLSRTTVEQLRVRQRGRVPLTALSGEQRAALVRLAHMRGMVDEAGRPTRPSAQLCYGVAPTWHTHLRTVREGGQPLSIKLVGGGSPPSAALVSAPNVAPLSGSVLWWAWPHSGSVWGQEPVSIERGVYTLDDLAKHLSGACGLRVRAGREVARRTISAVAREVPVRKLLWAVEVATGLPVEYSPESRAPEVTIGVRDSTAHWYHPDRTVLGPLPGLGYWSVTDTPAGDELLPLLEGGPTDRSQHWIGWVLADLPLLYQERIQTAWERTCGSVLGKTAPGKLRPDRTVVLWTKAVRVNLGLFAEDDSGYGYEWVFPALWPAAKRGGGLPVESRAIDTPFDKAYNRRPLG